MFHKPSAALLTVLAAGLLSGAPAHAQFSFSTGFDQTYAAGTGGLEAPFVFTVAGGSATKNNAKFSEANSNYNLTLSGGSNASFKNGFAVNLPSIVVNNGGASGDYTIITTLNTDYTNPSPVYASAGLAVFDSFSSYVEFTDTHNGNGFPGTSNAGNGQFTTVNVKGGAYSSASSQLALASVFTDPGAGASGTAVAAGTATPKYVTLSITKTGSTIVFGYVTTAGVAGTSFTVSSASTGNNLALYNYLSDINGKQIGLYTEPAGTATVSGMAYTENSTVSFGSLSVSVAAAPEPSSWVALLVGMVGVGLLSVRARRRAA